MPRTLACTLERRLRSRLETMLVRTTVLLVTLIRRGRFDAGVASVIEGCYFVRLIGAEPVLDGFKLKLV